MAYKLLDSPDSPRQFRVLDPLYRDRSFHLVDEGKLRTAAEMGIRGVAGVATLGMSETLPLAWDLVRGGKPLSGTGRLLGWNKNTKFVDRAQDIVDVIGVIDPTGVADASNALGYLARGKYGDAAASVAGIIPYLGDVGKVGKWAGRGGKMGKGAVRAAEKGAVRDAEKGAVRGAVAGGVARRPTRWARVKQTYQKGKEVYGRAREAHEKIKARRDQEIPPSVPKRGSATGRPQAAPARSRSPLGGGEPPTPERPTGGSTSQGPRGSMQVATGGKCPTPRTKTSEFGAQPGQKRCSLQTIPRDH